jgi:hypothetical protein
MHFADGAIVTYCPEVLFSAVFYDLRPEQANLATQYFSLPVGLFLSHWDQFIFFFTMPDQR